MINLLYVFDSVFQTNVEIAKEAASIFANQSIHYRIRRMEQVRGESSQLPFAAKNLSHDYELVRKEDMEWADSYVIASPIHTGMMSAATKYFIDCYHEDAVNGIFVDKPFTGIVTGGLVHGGTEKTLEQLYSVAMQWGCLIVSTNLTSGYQNPYGVSFIMNHEKPYNTFFIRSALEEHLIPFIELTRHLKHQNKDEKKTKIFRISDVFGY
ncbi:flavodoxin family protein [Vagococcus sp. BWB3-3]|uniref:Flavodoxin family protein n=1 Tax=Vagococcus allomyrinae TaxID=2794353 RepID=A0A940SUB9_9ENTE|nr:NAD(P)H-dependent oxidoreductase [Vagococcus allomyrinae]MBP1041160.1 flavodoxin family protein [Vagococcus allomyrinae]